MELILIAAVAANGVIGGQGSLPWRIPEDMAHFKATTMGHSVLMGRTTYASIGGLLPGRSTIVLSRNPHFQAHSDCRVLASLGEALASCRNAAKVFVAGGAQLYQAALPLADTLLLTRIEKEYAGDAFFPDFSAYPFILTACRPLPTKSLAPDISVRIETYRRVTNQARPALV